MGFDSADRHGNYPDRNAMQSGGFEEFVRGYVEAALAYCGSCGLSISAVNPAVYKLLWNDCLVFVEAASDDELDSAAGATYRDEDRGIAWEYLCGCMFWNSRGEMGPHTFVPGKFLGYWLPGEGPVCSHKWADMSLEFDPVHFAYEGGRLTIRYIGAEHLPIDDEFPTSLSPMSNLGGVDQLGLQRFLRAYMCTALSNEYVDGDGTELTYEAEGYTIDSFHPSATDYLRETCLDFLRNVTSRSMDLAERSLGTEWFAITGRYFWLAQTGRNYNLPHWGGAPVELCREWDLLTDMFHSPALWVEDPGDSIHADSQRIDLSRSSRSSPPAPLHATGHLVGTRSSGVNPIVLGGGTVRISEPTIVTGDDDTHEVQVRPGGRIIHTTIGGHWLELILGLNYLDVRFGPDHDLGVEDAPAIYVEVDHPRATRVLVWDGLTEEATSETMLPTLLRPVAVAPAPPVVPETVVAESVSRVSELNVAAESLRDAFDEAVVNRLVEAMAAPAVVPLAVPITTPILGSLVPVPLLPPFVGVDWGAAGPTSVILDSISASVAGLSPMGGGGSGDRSDAAGISEGRGGSADASATRTLDEFVRASLRLPVPPFVAPLPNPPLVIPPAAAEVRAVEPPPARPEVPIVLHWDAANAAWTTVPQAARPSASQPTSPPVVVPAPAPVEPPRPRRRAAPIQRTGLPAFSEVFELAEKAT